MATAKEVTNLAHLPLSYENRCHGAWFGRPDVQYYGDNPMQFCSQPKNHPGSCTCKCGAIEATFDTGRIEPIVDQIAAAAALSSST
jgi:hypothetical protein